MQKAWGTSAPIHWWGSIRNSLYLAEVGVLNSAGSLGVAGELGHIHERLGGHRGPRGDACGRQQVLLYQVYSPDQQVDVPHGAAPHAAVHFYQAGPPGGVLQLHMENTLNTAASLRNTLQNGLLGVHQTQAGLKYKALHHQFKSSNPTEKSSVNCQNFPNVTSVFQF